MARRQISSGSPYEDQAAYSRAVVDGRWCFVAGTTGFDTVSGVYPSDVTAQARNALATISEALRKAGFEMSHLVRTRIYITDRDHMAQVMAALREVFADTRPAATMVVCDLIDPVMKVEIEVTALAPEEPEA